MNKSIQNQIFHWTKSFSASIRHWESVGLHGYTSIFLISAQKHRLWVLTVYVLSSNKKNIRFFIWKLSFSGVKTTPRGFTENQRVLFDPYRHKVLSHVISPRTLHIYQRYELRSDFEVSPKYSKQKKTDRFWF